MGTERPTLRQSAAQCAVVVACSLCLWERARLAAVNLMRRTRSEAIADAIAKRIMANTRKRFSSLHSEALTEINMATETTSGMNTQSSAVPAPAAKQTDFKDLKTGEDFRSQAAPAVMPPQPAPRAETNDELEGAGA